MGISSSSNVEIERNINKFRDTLRKFHLWEGKHNVLEKNINMYEFSMKMEHKKQGKLNVIRTQISIWKKGGVVASLLQYITL